LKNDELKDLISESKTVNLYGQLHGDILDQNRLLINGVPITIRLIRSKDEFCFIKDSTATGNLNPKIIISNVTLFLRRAKIYPDVHAGISLRIRKNCS
jgi:hypothetical protein